MSKVEEIFVSLQGHIETAYTVDLTVLPSECRKAVDDAIMTIAWEVVLAKREMEKRHGRGG